MTDLSIQDTGEGISANWAGRAVFLPLVPRAISAGDREKVEGWFAHKWGQEANLQSAHPYKSSPP